jgi:agmatinase
LELFDSELGVETFKVGIQTLDEVEPNVNSPFENSQVVEAVVSDVLEGGKVPVVVGGDHSLTVGAVRAVLNRYPDIGFLMLDAHPDLFDRYEGTEYGHTSVARRVHELGVTIAIAGMRSASWDEASFIRDCGVNLVTAREILQSKESFGAILAALPERVYLSIDLDVMDPGEMPAVANPEPGGLGWYDVVDCLEKLTREKAVVGFDVVELCPIPGNPTPDFTAAKLIYRAIGLVFRDRLTSGGTRHGRPRKVRSK